jgi:hypothetical protein
MALSVAALSFACATTPVGGASVGTGTGTGTDAGVTDSGQSGTSGDNTKNTATIQTKDESGKAGKVETNKAASKEEATQKNNAQGAVNAGKMLSLHVVDGATASVLVVYVDTDKAQIPGKVPVGAPNSAAWVTLTEATPAPGVYNSKDKGEIEISTCPEKAGVAVTGKLIGVVLYNETPAAGGAKQKTLDGPFNLVYFGGAGELTCKKLPVTEPADAATTDGGTGSAKLPHKGKTCDANLCDGGNNTARMCCKYVPCLVPCWQKCATDAQSCYQSCVADLACFEGCNKKILECWPKCPSECKVDAPCSAALSGLDKCQKGAANSCEGGGPENKDACLFDTCCKEWKAAF